MTVLRPQPEGIPLPVPDAVSAPFWEGCAAGELRFQRCEACAAALFEPAILCRRCGSRSLTWERSAGVGTVYSWSTVWRPQSPAFEVPYTVVIVDLDEGYQLLSSVVGCEPDDVHVGMRVSVEFHPAGDDVVLPYFRPLGNRDELAGCQSPAAEGRGRSSEGDAPPRRSRSVRAGGQSSEGQDARSETDDGEG